MHCPAKPAIFACDFGRLEPRTGPSLLVPRGRGRGPLRFRTITCWRPCWLSVGAHGRMATGSVCHAESGLRSIEVPYCLRRLLLCPFGTQYGLVFSGRPAGRPVYAPLRERAAPPPGDLPGTRPAPRRSAFRAPRAWLGSSAPSPRPPWRWPPSLRSASARRRRRGLPSSRPAPRRSACRARGPGSDPRLPLLDHRGGGRLHSATLACGAAAGALPGSRPAPRRSACRARGPG